MNLLTIIEELEEAVKALDPPFLALPEDGWTLEKLAYQRGMKDAYTKVVVELRKVK